MIPPNPDHLEALINLTMNKLGSVIEHYPTTQDSDLSLSEISEGTILAHFLICFYTATEGKKLRAFENNSNWIGDIRFNRRYAKDDRSKIDLVLENSPSLTGFAVEAKCFCISGRSAPDSTTNVASLLNDMLRLSKANDIPENLFVLVAFDKSGWKVYCPT